MNQSHFQYDRPRGDNVSEFIYKVIFLGKDGLDLSENETTLINFDENPELQYAGVDLIVRDYKVEIKAAVDWAGPSKKTGYPLGTFAQEISYINKGGMVRDGWLVDPAKETDIFVFCWFPKVREGLTYEESHSYYRIEDIDDVRQLDVAIIEKDKLLGILLSALQTKHPCSSFDELKDWLRETAEEMRRKDVGIEYLDSSKIFKMVTSKKLEERSINVLVPKAQIEQNAFRCFRVTHDPQPSRFEWAIHKLK